MDNNPDTLQTALHFYNDGKEQEALQLIEKYIQTDTSRYNAKMYAGIVSLRLKDYDKALSWFNQLATYRLEVNPAVFYQALTLIKRNLPGDIDNARQLLQRVVWENLGEKEAAQRLLDKL
jgi:tetratricopeptide (TPR) repeat protein